MKVMHFSMAFYLAYKHKFEIIKTMLTTFVSITIKICYNLIMFYPLFLNILLFKNIYFEPITILLAQNECHSSINKDTKNWKNYYEKNLELSFKYPEDDLPYVYEDFGTTFYSEHKVGNTGIEDVSIKFASIPEDMRKGIEISVDGLYKIAKARNRFDEVIDLKKNTICGVNGVESRSNWKIANTLLEKSHEFYFIKGHDVLLAQLVVGSKYLNTPVEEKYTHIFNEMLYTVLVNNL